MEKKAIDRFLSFIALRNIPSAYEDLSYEADEKEGKLMENVVANKPSQRKLDYSQSEPLPVEFMVEVDAGAFNSDPRTSLIVVCWVCAALV